MHQNGFKNTVAILGSSISKQQRNLIMKLRPKVIYLFFDRDAPGAEALAKSLRMLRKTYPTRIVLYPKDTNDPAEIDPVRCSRAIEKAITPLQLSKRLRAAGVNPVKFGFAGREA
jgi:DNA primase